MRSSMLLAALPALLFASASAHAALIGDNFSARYHYPDVATIYIGATAPLDFTVGAGAEGMISVEDVTFLTFDFTDNSLTVDFDTILSSPTWRDEPFNGLIFTALDSLDVSAAFVAGGTTMVGFDDSRISLVGNQIRLNWAGLGYVDGTTVRINFEPLASPIPEPQSWALLITGFCMAGSAMRFCRRRRKAVAA